MEDLIELRRFKEATYIFLDPDQDEVSAMRGDPVHCFNKECDAPTVDPCDFVEVDDYGSFSELSGHADDLASPFVRGLGMACRHPQIEWLRRTAVSPSFSEAFLRGTFES